MTVYRLTEGKYAESLDGYGAKRYGGRWNSAGVAVLYTTEFISLAVLEVLIRIPLNQMPASFVLLKIDLPDKLPVTAVELKNIKSGWKNDIGYSRYIGDSFLKENSSPILKVPSAVIDEEHNFLLNTAHPDFKHIKIRSVSDFNFDERLFLRNE